MGPGGPSYFFPQQQQQHQQQQQPQFPLQLSPGFAPIPVQQIAPGAPYHPSFFAQSISNGLQPYVGLPTGGGNLPGAQQRGVLPLQDAALLQHPWNHVSHETQVWGSGGLQRSHQGLIQPTLMQHVSLQQQTFRPDVLPSSISRNGGIRSQFEGADRPPPAHAQQPFLQSNESRSQFGMAPAAMGQRSRMQPEGVQGAEAFHRNVYGGGHPVANGHAVANGQSYNKPRENGSSSPGKWPRGGANHGSSNSRFRGGKSEHSRDGDSVRSKAAVMKCDPCARTFTNSQQSNAHFSTHVRCDAEGCSFEASGRVLKEHRQASHGITSESPARTRTFKNLEGDEELIKWREERKVNYPTTANIVRKAEEAKARRLRGELVDEDARKRRERLREILAKQAELGCPVAEVPSYYMRDHNSQGKTKSGRPNHLPAPQNGSDRKRLRDEKSVPIGVTEAVAATESSCTATPYRNGRLPNVGENSGDDLIKSDVEEPEHKIARKGDVSVDSRDGQSGVEMEVSTERDVQTTSVAKEEAEAKPTRRNTPTDQGGSSVARGGPPGKEKVCMYYLRGRCKKGNRCEYLHERRPKKKSVPEQPAPKRTATLLEKLLESDVRKEKSHLLQAFRFFVNNMFLLEYPEKPLNFFHWQKDAAADGKGQQQLPTPLDVDTIFQADGSLEAPDVCSGSPCDDSEIQQDAPATGADMHIEDENCPP